MPSPGFALSPEGAGEQRRRLWNPMVLIVCQIGYLGERDEIRTLALEKMSPSEGEGRNDHT